MLYSTTVLTLDGVMSDPHVWHPPYTSDESVALLGDHLDSADVMLVGRRTFEEFAAWWPTQPDEVPLARRTNAIAKVAATSTPVSTEWSNSSVIAGGLEATVHRWRDEGVDVMVPGAGRSCSHC